MSDGSHIEWTDTDESQHARWHPLPRHRYHALDCTCWDCIREDYQPGDGS